MRSGVIAQKMGMTRVFTEAGEHVPVTVLRLANCQVIAHRTKDKNGYIALQLGSGTRKPKNLTKAERGNFALAKVEPKRKLAEFRVEEKDLIPVGAEITAHHHAQSQSGADRRRAWPHSGRGRGARRQGRLDHGARRGEEGAAQGRAEARQVPPRRGAGCRGRSVCKAGREGGRVTWN